MASKQWNLGIKEAMASTMQVNYVATHSMLQTFAGQRVHQKCRQKYCHVKAETSSASRTLRSSEPTFDSGEGCLFCNQPAKDSTQK